MADEDSEEDYVASENGESSPSSGHGEPHISPAGQSRKTPHQPKSNQKPAKGYLSKDYRDLLNNDIEDFRARAQSSELQRSLIGASEWTTREKDAFFQCLASSGPNDLKALVWAVRTKSEQEIRVYLLLLQAGVNAQTSKESSLQMRSAFVYDQVPGAAEISLEGEHALGLAADALAAHVEKHIHQQQHEKHGDDWLVDAEVAEDMDLLYEQIMSETEVSTQDSAEADEGGSVNLPSRAVLHADSNILLRPSALLQLSRDIFMNNGEDDDLNWHHVDSISPDSTEPALFRSTLEDLRNTVVSITRRIVQTTIFQATSRLRAEDASRKDWSPLAAIREVDVRTAVDLLNIPRDNRTYWAGTARRCRIGVFSDSKKYADGRPSTKSGHRLTYEEVEKELGLHSAENTAAFTKFETESLDEGDIDDLMDDSDLFTDEEITTSKTESHPETGGQTSPVAPKRRKRAMSPSAFLRAETSHLEAVDVAASTREEMRLWGVIRHDPPEHIATDHQPPAGLSHGSALDSHVDWRARLDYESEWEQVSGTPAAKRFKNMNAMGEAGKARRKILAGMVDRRLQMTNEHHGSETDATNDEMNDADDDDYKADMKPAVLSMDSDS